MSESTNPVRADIDLAKQLNSAVARLLDFDADAILSYLTGPGFRMLSAKRTIQTDACYVAVTALLPKCFSVARTNGYSADDAEERIEAIKEALFAEQRSADDLLAAPRFTLRQPLTRHALEAQFSHLRREAEQSVSPPSAHRKAQQDFAELAIDTLTLAAVGTDEVAQETRSLGLLAKWQSNYSGVLDARDQVLSLVWAVGHADPDANTTDKPHWDGVELRYGNTVVRSYQKRKAPKQAAILAALEKAGWPAGPVEMPESCQPELHTTLLHINQKIEAGVIKLQAAGDSKSVIWKKR